MIPAQPTEASKTVMDLHHGIEKCDILSALEAPAASVPKRHLQHEGGFNKKNYPNVNDKTKKCRRLRLAIFFVWKQKLDFKTN